MRMGGALYLNAEFTAPWCTTARPDRELCKVFQPRSDRVISFHLIVAGSCLVQLAGDPSSAIHVNTGELLVVPHGDEHIMGSTLDLAPLQSGPVLAEKLDEAPGEIIKLSYGGGGTATRMMCGFLACDETLSNPLLSALPRIFKVDMRDDPSSAWLESSLQFAAAESTQLRPGSALIIGKLSELLFVEAVRRCIDALPADRKGWLAGMRDRFVGRALSMLHAQPAHDWTVDELARKVGLSRSALAQRFTDLLDEPPMQYLTRWRLQIAAHELVSGGRSLAEIAVEVGYESEAAFNRAFKREFGMPPAGWRKSRGKPGAANAHAMRPADEAEKAA